MELGWIDFSKSERAKVLDVINLLSEDGTLDELGISAIRDGFANLFFPGTSTIQTRAKYFLIVPYALSDLEHAGITNPQVFFDKMNELERNCGEILLGTSEEGIIGARNLKSGNWVKRTPAEIYWSGIRTYGILTDEKMSYSEYVKASCLLHSRKKALKSQWNCKKEADEGERDDTDAGNLFSTVFWKLPEYQRDIWRDNLKIELTQQEASFLRQQIVAKCPESLMAVILNNNRQDVLQYDNFDDTANAILPLVSSEKQNELLLAKAAGEFIYGMRIRYNIILSQGQNEEANAEWVSYSRNLEENAAVDIRKVFGLLQIYNGGLLSFLLDIQKYMLNMDEKTLAAMDERIIRRECQLKTNSRAKLLKAGEFPLDAWFGGGRLDFRFNSAKQILKDIFEAEVNVNA